jgi:hypothetical protein
MPVWQTCSFVARWLTGGSIGDSFARIEGRVNTLDALLA